MNFSATIWGQLFFVLAIVFIVLTMKFAKGKVDSQLNVFIYSTLFNFFVPPIGWYYCYRWAKR